MLAPDSLIVIQATRTISSAYLLGSGAHSTRSPSALPTSPAQARRHLDHRDALVYRTHQRAQIAPHALRLIHARNPLHRSYILRPVPRNGIQLRNRRHRNRRSRRRLNRAGVACSSTGPSTGPDIPIAMDTLMRAIPARDVAQVAPDALRLVDPRDDFVIQVEMLPLRHARQSSARENPQWSRSPSRSSILRRPSIMSSTMRYP